MWAGSSNWENVGFASRSCEFESHSVHQYCVFNKAAHALARRWIESPVLAWLNCVNKGKGDL